jgi:putative membrane protein
MAERLHPAAIAIYALKTLREGALPLVALLVFAVAGDGLDERALLRGAALALGGAALAALAGLVRWAATTYAVEGEVIHHRRGWLSVKETDVPFARVQSLDTEQGPVQRLFGVQAVHVQTGAGGAGGEIVLEALAAEDVARLRAVLARHRPRAAAADGAAPPERRLGRRRLLLAALTSGQIGVILPALAGLSQVLDDFVTEQPRGEEATRLLPQGALEWALAAGGLLVLAWLLSVLGAIVAFAGFRATREGDRLRIGRGLVQRRDVTLPVARVRAVRVVEGVLRRPLGLATLRVEVLGFAKEPAAARTLFPLLRRGEVHGFLAELLPEMADEPEGLAPPPRRAQRRYLLPPAAAGLLAGAAAAWPLGSPWPLLAALAGLAYGRLRWRAAGWRLAGGRLAVSSLLLARTTVLAPAAGRESHALAQSLLQRRARLADVEVAFGKTTTARMRHLDLQVARDVWTRIT